VIENQIRKFDPKSDGLLMLIDAMDNGGDPSRAIIASEAAGQRQLVASAVMPTETGDRAEYEALGFTFGEPVAGDEIFTQCTLPEGWTKQASDHNMWSYIHDQLNRRRVAVFYKAAYYDRSAFCRIETPYTYLSNALYYKTDPVLDDAWLTVESAATELEVIAEAEDQRSAEAREFATKQGSRPEYWTKQAAEHTASAAAARALAARIAGVK
jgi:hypothetical protein